MRGVSRKPSVSWRRKLLMGTIRMKSPPLRKRSPERQDQFPPEGEGASMPLGLGWCGPMCGIPPTWENRPSGTANKEMEERGKEGGPVPHDAAESKA